MLFLLVNWIHILFTITTVEANITHGIEVARASGEPKVLPFILRNLQLIEQRIAHPGYGLFWLAGLTLACMTRLPLTTPWLLAALILCVIAAMPNSVIYAPVSRRQIRLMGSDALRIVFLMVIKPTWWG